MDEFDIQLKEAIARRQAGREDSQNFQMPQGQMVGGRYIRPSFGQALVQGLRTYQGQKDYEQAGQQIKDLTASRQKAIADALRQFGQASQGTPENAPGDGVGPVMPAQAPDMMGAYQRLLEAPDAGLRNMAAQGMARIPELQAQREAKMEERRMMADQRAAELKMQHDLRMQQMAEQNATRQQMAQEQRNFQMEMAKIQQSMGGGAQPYFQPVQTAQGVMAFNARTGRVEPVSGPDGRPIVGAAADPALQGQITGAETSARKQAESQAEAKGDVRKANMFLSQLQQAEEILKQGPTQSGAGAAIDAAGRLVGVSTAGAQRAGQLEALSGWLVSNVPRMEGPQSNFDVQNYMTMAGKIGDRTVPVAERMAAVKEVRRLQQKYRDVGVERAGQQSQTEPRPRIRFDAQGNPIK